MRDKLYTTATMLVALAFGTQSAGAEDIARWVDDDGVTHFGNAQFAPSGAKRIDVAATNSMEVPDASSVASSGSGPVWNKVTKAPKKNKKGWRAKGESLYTGRKHQSRHRR